MMFRNQSMRFFFPTLMLLLATVATTNGETGCLSILLTNTAGINSRFLMALFQYIKEETCHKVLAVVPMEYQDFKSASLDFLEFDMEKGNPAPGVYSLNTTAATVVLYALDIIAPENDFVPDLVIAGPENDYNLGMITMHSGVSGAAATAMSRGLPTIIVSSLLCFCTKDGDFAIVASVVSKLIETKLINEEGDLILRGGEGVNVNIPPPGRRDGTTAASDVYSFELTRVGTYHPLGGPTFQRDVGLEWSLGPLGPQYQLPPGLGDGKMGLSFQYPFNSSAYPDDVDPHSEGIAIGANSLLNVKVVTVSPIKFTYETDPSAAIEKAFEKSRAKSGKQSKKSKKGSRNLVSNAAPNNAANMCAMQRFM